MFLLRFLRKRESCHLKSSQTIVVECKTNVWYNVDMLNGKGKEMNRRIAKKLRKEMISWKSVDSPVRHCPSSFRKAWKIEMLAAARGERWALPGWKPGRTAAA